MIILMAGEWLAVWATLGTAIAAGARFLWTHRSEASPLLKLQAWADRIPTNVNRLVLVYLILILLMVVYGYREFLLRIAQP